MAAIAAKLGRIPTVEEYLSAMQGIEPTSNDIYQYLNFDQISQYQKSVGLRPSFAAMAATSADDKYTSASSPRRLGKLRVEVETTVALSLTRA
jgi:hypothetical protein